MSPVRLHGKVFAVVEGNGSTVAPMAVASSNQRMIAGVAAASVSLGVAQLVGIPFDARADARAAIGSVVVDLTPGPIKEWAIQTLGSLDKLFLAVVVLVVIATIAAIAGTLETQRRPLGSAVIGGRLRMHRGVVAAGCDGTRHDPHRRGRRLRRGGPTLAHPSVLARPGRPGRRS
jgi:hypothetical protein